MNAIIGSLNRKEKTEVTIAKRQAIILFLRERSVIMFFRQI